MFFYFVKNIDVRYKSKNTEVNLRYIKEKDRSYKEKSFYLNLYSMKFNNNEIFCQIIKAFSSKVKHFLKLR
jgi:hypothetical protein